MWRVLLPQPGGDAGPVIGLGGVVAGFGGGEEGGGGVGELVHCRFVVFTFVFCMELGVSKE